MIGPVIIDEHIGPMTRGRWVEHRGISEWLDDVVGLGYSRDEAIRLLDRIRIPEPTAAMVDALKSRMAPPATLSWDWLRETPGGSNSRAWSWLTGKRYPGDGNRAARREAAARRRHER